MRKCTKGQILIGVAVALTSVSAFAEPLRVGPLSDGYRSYAYYDIKLNKRWGNADPASCSNMLSYLDGRHLVFLRDFAKSNVAVTDIAVELSDAAFFAGSGQYQGFFYMGSGAETEFIPVQYLEQNKNTFHFTYDRSAIGLRFDEMVSKAHSFVLKYNNEEAYFDLNSAPKNRKTFVKCLDNSLKGNFTLKEDESVSHLAVINAMLTQNIADTSFLLTEPTAVDVATSTPEPEMVKTVRANNDVLNLLDRSFGDAPVAEIETQRKAVVQKIVEKEKPVTVSVKSVAVPTYGMEGLLDDAFEISSPNVVPVGRVLLNHGVPKPKPVELNGLATPSELDGRVRSLLDSSFDKKTLAVSSSNRLVKQKATEPKKIEPKKVEITAILKDIEPAVQETSIPESMSSLIEQDEMAISQNQLEDRILEPKVEIVKVEAIKEDEIIVDEIVELNVETPKKLDDAVLNLLDDSFDSNEIDQDILNRVVPQKIIEVRKEPAPVLKEIVKKTKPIVAIQLPEIPKSVASLIEQDEMQPSQAQVENRVVEVKIEPVNIDMAQEEEIVFDDVVDLEVIEKTPKIENSTRNLLDNSFDDKDIDAIISDRVVEQKIAKKLPRPMLVTEEEMVEPVIEMVEEVEPVVTFTDMPDDVASLIEQDEKVISSEQLENRVLELEITPEVSIVEIDTEKEEEIIFDDTGVGKIETVIEAAKLENDLMPKPEEVEAKVDPDVVAEKEDVATEDKIETKETEKAEVDVKDVEETEVALEENENKDDPISSEDEALLNEALLNDGLNVSAIDQGGAMVIAKDKAVTIAEKGETDDSLRFKNILDGVRGLDSTESYEILGSPSSEMSDKELIDSLTQKLKLLEAEKESLRKRELQREMVGSMTDMRSTEETRREEQKKKSKRWWPFPVKMKHVPFK